MKEEKGSQIHNSKISTPPSQIDSPLSFLGNNQWTKYHVRKEFVFFTIDYVEVSVFLKCTKVKSELSIWYRETGSALENETTLPLPHGGQNRWIHFGDWIFSLPFVSKENKWLQNIINFFNPNFNFKNTMVAGVHSGGSSWMLHPTKTGCGTWRAS